MKKLIVAAVAVVVALATNAATVNWASGTLKGAADADGGWGSSSLANASKNPSTLWYAALYLVDSSTAATLTSADKILAYTGATTPVGITTGTGVSAQTTKTSGSTVQFSTDATVGTSYYAAMIVAYHDAALDKDFYIANLGQIAGSTIDNPGNTYSVTTILSSVASWTPMAGSEPSTPEPTSGVLMLLGMGMLALRRKRA